MYAPLIQIAMITQKELKSSYSFNPKTAAFVKLTKTERGKQNKPMGHVGPCGFTVVSVFGYYVYAERLAVFYQTGRFPTEPIENRGEGRLAKLLCENEKHFDQNAVLEPELKDDFTFCGDKEAGVYKSDKGYVVQAFVMGRIYKVKTYDNLREAIAHMHSIKQNIHK